MAIGNVQIVTFGWYSSVAVDIPGTVAAGPALMGLGWLVGNIIPPWTTAPGMINVMQNWPLIPKRFKFGR